MRLTALLAGAALATAAVPAGSASAAARQATAKCGLGTVRGIAYVTGDPKKGIANLPTTFSSAANLFGYRWNCGGGAVSVRLSDTTPGIDIKFAGNPGRFAVGNAISATAAVAITHNPDGSFHVAVAGDSTPTKTTFPLRTDVSFVIIVF